MTGSPNIPNEAFVRAEAAGKAVGSRNRVDFQNVAIPANDISLTYSATLNGGWAPGAAGNARYVRCTVQRTGIQPVFMQVLGIGDQSVNAIATATLAPAQTNCAVPMGLCVKPAALPGDLDFGYQPGEWVLMSYAEAGGGGGGGGGGRGGGGAGGNQQINYTGNFRWIDFTPNAPSPGCGNADGASELRCLMAGSGTCSLPEPTAANCAGGGGNNQIAACVGATGSINAMETAYNTRFGVYPPNGGVYNVTNAPPDFSGYSYSTENWALGHSAYHGNSGGLPNYKAARNQRLRIQDDPGITDPDLYGGNVRLATQLEHDANGADRRLVVVPIVACGANFTDGQVAPVRAYACVLMLDPYRRDGNNVVSRLEYIGRSNQAGSPCASSGIAGNATSQGPLVPSLVQ